MMGGLDRNKNAKEALIMNQTKQIGGLVGAHGVTRPTMTGFYRSTVFGSRQPGRTVQLNADKIT
jgi:hypothetical protein